MRSSVVILLILVLAENVAAEPSARHVVLTGTSEVVPVKVYPEVQSVFKFPERVIQAKAGNADYRVEIDGDTVHLSTTSRAMPTNLSIDTHTLHISLLLEMAPSIESAEPVVVFERKPQSALDKDVCAQGGMQLASFVGANSTNVPRGEWVDGSQYLRFRATSITWTEDFGLISFEVTNRGEYPFPVARIEAQDARGNDHARDVRVAVDDQVSEEVGTIPSGDTARISLLVSDPVQSRAGMRLVLMPDGAGAPAAFDLADDDWGHVNKGRSTVLISGGGGVFQLERERGSALVTTGGIGGSFSYGMTAKLSVDIGLGWMTSGEAELANVKSSDTLYRFQAGGRVLLTEEGWVPYLRGGAVGALVSESDGDDSSWAVRGAFLFSVGVMRWLSNALVLGAEAHAEFGGGGGGAVIARAQLGVAWGGNEL